MCYCVPPARRTAADQSIDRSNNIKTTENDFSFHHHRLFVMNRTICIATCVMKTKYLLFDDTNRNAYKCGEVYARNEHQFNQSLIFRLKRMEIGGITLGSEGDNGF